MEDVISETDGSSDNRDDDRVSLLAGNYSEILKVLALQFPPLHFSFFIPGRQLVKIQIDLAWLIHQCVQQKHF
jgi:hypothetical protein